VSRFYDRDADRLTELFYKGDRSMRESGFDPSNRFGPFSADIIHYTPVCLNVLLYRMEDDAAHINTLLGHSTAAAEWQARARRRRELIDRYLWDEGAGLYFDYNFETSRRRPYEFATTFYPLWAGIASREQARRVVANLPRFEAPGGLLTSTQTTGSQWDAPYGWAPLQMIAVDGLRRYGYNRDADRLARKFVSLVVDDFDAHGTIVEKYDVRRRSSDLGAGLRFGYTSNEVGFGWTNAAVLDLLAGLNRARRSALAAAIETTYNAEHAEKPFLLPFSVRCSVTCGGNEWERRKRIWKRSNEENEDEQKTAGSRGDPPQRVPFVPAVASDASFLKIRSLRRLRSSENELHRELEIPHRVGAEIRGRRDAAGVRPGVARHANLRVGVAEVHVVEEVHRLGADLDRLAVHQDEPLEERRIRSPVAGPDERVARQVAEGPRRRS
jgi:hypothetical protein